MLTPYQENIVKAFKKASQRNEEAGTGKGASAVDVTKVMAEDKTLAALDTVIDIADQLKELSERGYLGQ